MTHPKIGFRVDTGNIVGSGHLMEAIAIYKNLSSRIAFDPVFISVENSYIIEKLRIAGVGKVYPVAKDIVAEDLTEAEDVDKTIKIARANQCKHLIVDLPKRSESYYRKLYENIERTCVILDDSLRREISATSVINFSISQDESFYKSFEDSRKYSIGPRFVPLNEDILGFKPGNIEHDVKRIFVNQGASDPYCTTAKVVRALEKVEGNYAVDVLIGGLLRQDHQEEIRKEVNSSLSHKYNLFENLAQGEVFEMMSNADIAIAAAGNALYEIAYFGIPSIMIAPRAEFLQITESFERACLNINLGLRDNVTEDILKSKINLLIGDSSLRKAISVSLRGLVDGMGVNRICERILVDISSKQCLKTR